ncbi:MAG TPA: MOSC N-terminal beta barrel domain-containing protein, partial [Dyadobacter sp.]|nr:MOSC N-terminal beta barrel domain-containing protein [Dyadobacter sp.]
MIPIIMHDHSLPVKLSQIWIYPVKSLGGVRLKHAYVVREGLEYDRRWMIVDESGTFVTQRKLPEMSLLTVEMAKDGFTIESTRECCSRLFIPFNADYQNTIKVKVWNDLVEANPVGEEADDWLSERLHTKVRLVAVADISQRETFVESNRVTVPITFTDDFPIHLISESSLYELNTRLHEPVDIGRFRPNFVVTGDIPFAEDHWKKFQIGDAIFENISACERCVMININQQTGVKTTEPLRTLAGYRRPEKHILFGRNVIWEQTGVIREGDVLRFL